MVLEKGDPFIPLFNKDYGERRQGTGNGYRLFGIQFVGNSNVEEISKLVTASGMVRDDCLVASLDADSDYQGQFEEVSINKGT